MHSVCNAGPKDQITAGGLDKTCAKKTQVAHHAYLCKCSINLACFAVSVSLMQGPQNIKGTITIKEDFTLVHSDITWKYKAC